MVLRLPGPSSIPGYHSIVWSRGRDLADFNESWFGAAIACRTSSFGVEHVSYILCGPGVEQCSKQYPKLLRCTLVYLLR